MAERMPVNSAPITVIANSLRSDYARASVLNPVARQVGRTTAVALLSAALERHCGISLPRPASLMPGPVCCPTAAQHCHIRASFAALIVAPQWQQRRNLPLVPSVHSYWVYSG